MAHPIADDRSLYAPREAPEPAPDAPQGFAIEAKGLRKVYKAAGAQPAKEALKGIDLQIPRGSIFGLLGPNGAGKSTFINILAGLVIKSQGTACVWGFDIDVNPRMARASIGVVPQELNIDPFFTPAEVMEMQAGLYGVPKRERRTTEILTAMGLDDKADAYARTLSGGMRRRLLVAKAMVHNPPVLVLDEPTSGVSAEEKFPFMDRIMAALDRDGVTVLFVEHDMDIVGAYADRVLAFYAGQIIADGAPDMVMADEGVRRHVTGH